MKGRCNKMKILRQTYANIYLGNIRNNVSSIISKYNNYKYYFGVVKADCYGHNDILTVESIIDGGCNYLAVNLLEEALEIRSKIKDIPIICLGFVSSEYVNICTENNITITVNSLEYAKELIKENIKDLKVHIKINTGMNRLGISTEEEFIEVYNLLKNKVKIEGIYTHIYYAESKKDTIKQFESFEEMISNINVKDIPIIHIGASETTVLYEKLEFVNGCRLGIIMYGFTPDKSLNLKSTITLHSQVIQINHLKKGDKVGYNGIYEATKDTIIAVVSIGYADGIIRGNTGRTVFINNKEYRVVGNVCMDMLFVEIDDEVKVYDEVLILKDIDHIERVAKHLNTIPYEVICSIAKRIPRKFDKNSL